MPDHSSWSIAALRAAFVGGQASPLEILNTALERIGARNAEIGALTDVLRHTATREANQAQAIPTVGGLAGIPIAIKDNIDTAPALCSAGLPFLSTYHPAQDAAVVRRLREAGAVIVGVAATDAGAFGVTTPGVANPSFATKIAGGSSGGAAAAVTAGFCMAAVGTDTGGSIRIPAACCGIVGFKPTYGRVPIQGVRPLARSIDHVGLLARSVADVSAVMPVIDPNFSALPAGHDDRPARIGIPRAYFFDASIAVESMIDAVALRMREMGFEVRNVEIPCPNEIIPCHLAISLTEAALLHDGDGPHDLDAYPEVAREAILRGRSYSEGERIHALDRKHDFVERINAAFSEIDFLLLPTLPMEVPDRNDRRVPLAGTSYSLLEALIRYTAAFNQSGHPVVAMPWTCWDLGTAGSFQLVARRNSDKQLLTIAEQVERQVRR